MRRRLDNSSRLSEPEKTRPSSKPLELSAFAPDRDKSLHVIDRQLGEYKPIQLRSFQAGDVEPVLTMRLLFEIACDSAARDFRRLLNNTYMFWLPARFSETMFFILQKEGQPNKN